MGELAIITEEIAKELLLRGFKLKGFKKGKYTDVYYFENSVEVERAVEEIVASL